MKTSLSWLKTYLKTNASANEIADKLTNIGLEMEEVIDNASNLKGFIVGEIKEVSKHPNADKLNVLKVFDGQNDLQIVCGAPNVRVGMKSVLALPGTVIPKYGEKLEKGVIRGIESYGMMCAEDELCLGTDHTGIIDLKTNLPAGTPVEEVLDADVLFDINVLSNRPDCFGVRGLARDLSATGIGEFTDKICSDIEGKFECPTSVKIENKNCSCFALRYIRDVRNVESPDWMKNRLTSVGLRPICALVDITNFLCFDQCRPLHVFDADKVVGNLTVRSAEDGEKIECLDGKEYILSSGMMVVADEIGPVSIAGIMGGTRTAVDENTKNILLESAYFNPISVAKTARILKAESDSKMRFERGVDEKSTISGNLNATHLIMDLCGGEPSTLFVAGQEPMSDKVIDFDFNQVRRLTGMDIPLPQMQDILIKLGFKVNGNRITVPSWRNNDINLGADLVEEIVRIYGLEELPENTMRPKELPLNILLPNQKQEVLIRRALANRGLNQVITWSFMDSRLARMFDSKDLKIQNPIASDLDELRPNLIPNLLSAIKRNNANALSDVSLFEIGPEFFGIKPEEQQIVACAVRSGKTHPRHWLEKDRPVDVFDAKEDALVALRAGFAPECQVVAKAPAWYHPGRSGALCLGNKVLAYFGEIHPQILKEFDIKGPVVACEVYLKQIPPFKKKANKNFEKLTLQPLSRDFCFVVSKDVQAQKIVQSIMTLDRELISDVRVFDVYNDLPDDKKSVALEVVIQPKEKTLTDDEIELICQRIIGIVSKNTGATLRQ